MILKRNAKKIVWLLIAIIAVVIFYVTYISIYPGDSFYNQEFKEVTGLNLPNSANILYKESSFAFNGESCSAALIELNSKDYASLLQELKTNQKLNDTIVIGSSELNNMENKVRNKSIAYKFTKELITRKFYLIEFYDDNKTIIIENIK